MNERESALFLYEEAMGYTYAAALRAAAELGVADAMADGWCTAAQLAEAVGADAGRLRRVLRLLAARGIVMEDGAGRFALTDRGAALRSDAAVPARSGVLMFTDTMFWTMAHEAARAVADPQPSFAQVFGRSLGEYFDADPDIEALYYDGMATVSDAEHPLLVAAYDFPEEGVVADIGGGRGAFLQSVLLARPRLRGVLLDQPHMVKEHRLDASAVAGRAEVLAGDFLADVPAADVYLLKRILHNWDDERSIRILSNCRRAMRPDGRVLVIDAVIPDGDEPHQSRQMDFMMLAALTGQERSAAELRPLFDAAGLRVTRIIPTASPVAIVEGRAA
ncbi:methyltransferase [Micromonospora sp. NPDC003776]